jgi:hypothetical protein
MFASWSGNGKTIVDMGRHHGSLMQRYPSGNRMMIVDVDGAAIALAKELLNVNSLEVSLNEPLPFETGSVDTVVVAEAANKRTDI